MPAPTLSRSTVEFVREAVLAFYAEEHRDFPWRKSPSPYAVLVSEMMLQQTRAETVVPYFERWMERFPTMSDLAGADTEEVLVHWQGLGYYHRARNLHGAVREVIARYRGAVPRDPAELRSLPGIGPYTAGAVASIAYGVPTAAVDGNVRRVLARFMDAPAPSSRALEGWASALVDPTEPGSFNQGLMELGARVCTPPAPRCGACPLAPRCGARLAGTQAERPARPRRKAIPRVTEAVVALVCETESRRSVLLRRRPGKGLLAGMWELPGTPLPADAVPETVAREAAGSLVGEAPECHGGVEPLEHVFSHRRVRYVPFLYTVPSAGAMPSGDADGMRWVEESRAGQFPMSVAQRTILQRVYAANLPAPAL